MKSHLRNHRIAYMLASYAFVAVLMFGFTAARIDKINASDDAAYTKCEQAPGDGASCNKPVHFIADVVLDSMLAGVFWPLDLVWIVADKLEGVPA